MNFTLPAEDLELVLQCVDWEPLRGRRVFMTGATGFFGRWLTETFLYANRKNELGARLSILCRNPQKAQTCFGTSRDLSIIEGEMASFVFPSDQFDLIVHAATCDERTKPLPAIEVFSQNVGATSRLLQFAGTCGANRFLFLSSGAVYGKQPPELLHIQETYAGAPPVDQPVNAYAQSKRVSEYLCTCQAAVGEFSAVSARCFAFVGPHMPLFENFAIGNFIGNALRGEPIMINGDGTPVRSYLYMADAAIWLWTLLLKADAGAYNVGSEKAVSIMELATTVAELLSPGLEIRVLSQPALGKPPDRYLPETWKAREHLGLECRVDLREAIVRTANWFKQQMGAAAH